MNYIGLDISKISTDMVIESINGNYLFSYNTHKINYKWNKSIIDIKNIKIRTYEYDNNLEYSEMEINKLVQFINISNDIINDILTVIDINESTIIYMEGYSYGRDPGPIIDLVGIASIVRAKIYENIPNINKIKIISPKSLKTISAEMIYGYDMIDIGKKKQKIIKQVNTNEKGIKGGDFSKHDMFQAIVDYNKNYILNEYLIENYDEIIGLKSFPKPIEDINDAFLLKEIIKYIEK